MFRIDNYLVAVAGTLTAVAVATALGWLRRFLLRVREVHLLPSRVSLVFEDTDQFRRTEGVAGARPGSQRNLYVVGVLNDTSKTLSGVQCFVTSVEEFPGEQKSVLYSPLGHQRMRNVSMFRRPQTASLPRISSL